MISEDLKEYLNHRTDGYFEFKKGDGENPYPIGYSIKSCVKKYFLSSAGNYFIKDFNSFTESHPMVSAEVLLSRLLPKLGFKSVEYLPFVSSDGSLSVISKELYGINISDGLEFFSEVMFKSPGRGNCFLNKDLLCFADEKNRGELNTINNFLQYADANFLRQLFLLRGVDLAIGNSDRNPENLFVERDYNGVARNIITLDNEASGSIDCLSHNFYSEFGKRMPSKDLIKAFKENEDYQKYITRFEIAETIASAPFDETAREVKDEMGFTVEPNFLDRMKSNTDMVAEELVK